MRNGLGRLRLNVSSGVGGGGSRRALRTVVLSVATVAMGLFSAPRAGAKPIDDATLLTKDPRLTTVTFDEAKQNTNRSLPDAGQPYAWLGLRLPNQEFDTSGLMGADAGTSVRSTQISTISNANVQVLSFAIRQKALGFSVFDPKARSIIVEAIDIHGTVLETVILPGSTAPQYVGFLREDDDIATVRITAPHDSVADAVASPTIVDNVTFATPFVVHKTDGGVGRAFSPQNTGVPYAMSGDNGSYGRLAALGQFGGGARSGGSGSGRQAVGGSIPTNGSGTNNGGTNNGATNNGGTNNGGTSNGNSGGTSGGDSGGASGGTSGGTPSGSSGGDTGGSGGNSAGGNSAGGNSADGGSTNGGSTAGNNSGGGGGSTGGNDGMSGGGTNGSGSNGGGDDGMSGGGSGGGSGGDDGGGTAGSGGTGGDDSGGGHDDGDLGGGGGGTGGGGGGGEIPGGGGDPHGGGSGGGGGGESIPEPAGISLLAAGLLLVKRRRT